MPSYQNRNVDRSGEIIAGGVDHGIAGLAQGLLRYQENEKQRQIAAGQIQGLLASSPQLASKTDPKMLDKLSTGKATLADTLQLLGTLSTARQAEEETLQAKLRDAQIGYYNAQSAALTAKAEPRPDPRLMELAPGVRVIVDANGNAQQPRVDTARPSVNPAEVVQVDAGGTPTFYHPASKKFLDSKTGQPVQTAAGKAQPGEFEKTLQGALGKQVAEFLDKAPEYQNTLEQIQRGRAAIAAGAQTGGLADLKLGIAQTVNGIIPGSFSTAKEEIAKTSFADMAVSAASRMRGTGQITENERKLLADTVAKFGNSPQAAEYIMSFMEAAAQRGIKKAEAIQTLRDAGETNSAKYSAILSGWEKDNPIDLQAANAVPPPANADISALGDDELARRIQELQAKKKK